MTNQKSSDRLPAYRPQRIFMFSFLILFAGCASQRPLHLDRDLNNPAYHEGRGLVISDHVELQTLSTRDMRYEQAVRSGSEEYAVAGLLSGGISWAMYPDYYKKSTVSGQCIMATEGTPPLRIGCRNLGITLFDLEGTEIGRTQTNENGEFAFFVKRAKQYRLELRSDRYRLKTVLKPLRMGDFVTLEVSPTDATAAPQPVSQPVPEPTPTTTAP